MTDEQIVKALDCCCNDGSTHCPECPYYQNEPCIVKMEKDIWEYITRLEQMIGGQLDNRPLDCIECRYDECQYSWGNGCKVILHEHLRDYIHRLQAKLNPKN